MQNPSEPAPRKITARISKLAGAIAFLSALSPSLTETAVANGDTRTINLYHTHTHEQISATYLVNGQYDQAVLKQLNWFLRDWRRDEPTTMDPRLFDVVWEAYRQAGATELIHVVSAYRSPETNAMLRRRSRAVAKYSQHMLGKAMDTTMPGMSMSRIREIGMRMQRGGVGYYPTAGTPFVHLDVGSVRSWPRMTYDQLVRLFPDGKTVHLPTNGQPLARYEEARAEIEARGGGAYVPTERRSRGFLAFLFGGGGEDDEDSGEAVPAPSQRKQWASLAPRSSNSIRGGPIEQDEEAGAAASNGRNAHSDMLARAEGDLPRGETQFIAAPGGENGKAASDQTQAANAPVPPTRPPSLGKTASDGRVSVAALETAEAAMGREQAPDVETNAVPLPPRRPLGLALLAPAPPTPPARPAGLVQTAAVKRESDVNAAAALAKLIDVTGSTPMRAAIAPAAAQTDEALSGSISGVSQNAADAGEQGKADDSALAYAAPAKHSSVGEIRSEAPTGLRAAAKSAAEKPDARRAALVPARLDRSNFGVLTGAVPASRAGGASVLGAALGAPRMAARAGSSVLHENSGARYVSSFAANAAAPPSDQFRPAR